MKEIWILSYHCVLMRYGELSLKGKNKISFENRLVKNIRDKMGDLSVKLTKTAGRIFLELEEHDPAKILENLGQVFGLSSFSPVLRTSRDLTEMENKITELVKQQVALGKRSFKVHSRRSDRSFELTSLEMNI